MVTFATGGDAFTLENAIAGTIKDAQVQGTQMVLRSVLSYTAAARAMGGEPRAFEDATKFLVANMLRSVAKKLEIELLYGQVGYGVVSAVSGLVVTISTAEWAAGIWAGAEGMRVEIRDTTGATSRGSAYVDAVDMTNRTITLNSVPGGTVATDVIWHYGAYGNEFAGIHKILTNTGTLFNISAASYTLWKGVEHSCGTAAFSLTKLLAGVAKAVEKGLDTDMVVHVNPKTWANLLNDQAALRKYDSSYNARVAENGASSIKFHSQNGQVEIQPNIFVKEGYAYGLCMDDLVRVGSTDITFKRPGQGDEFFRDLESAAGYELRAFTDQALFCSAPGKMILFKDIVNT